MTADAQVITTSDHAPADAHGSGGIGIPVLGMLLFITSEVMFFAGLFAAYFSIRASFIDTRRDPPLAAQRVRRDPQPVPPDHGARRSQPDPAGDPDPDHFLVHLPDGPVGDRAR